MRRAILIALFCGLAIPQSAEVVPLPLKQGSVRFAAFGDMGTGGRLQYQVAQQMAEQRQRFPFDFVLMLGDNLYGGKSPRDFEKKFAIPYKPLLDAGVKFHAALGNHDIPDERLYKPFNMNGERFYTFKVASVRFFALDSNYMDPAQLQWLENELKNSGSDWKIAYFHHPLYSSGRAHGSSTELRGLLEPLFVKYGVQIVLAGHEHSYERVKPQKGIHYFIAGSGGKLKRGNLRNSDFKAAGFDQDCAFLVMEITGDQLFFQAISRTGATVDSGVITRPTAEAKANLTSRRASWPVGHVPTPARTPAEWTIAHAPHSIRESQPAGAALVPLWARIELGSPGGLARIHLL